MGDALACVFNTAGLYVERRWMKKATGGFFFFLKRLLLLQEDFSHRQGQGGGNALKSKFWPQTCSCNPASVTVRTCVNTKVMKPPEIDKGDNRRPERDIN